MLGGIGAPASRIFTFTGLLGSLLSSFAISAPAKPAPTIATSHSMQDSAAIVGSSGQLIAYESSARTRWTRPVTELHFAESHGMRLGHPQSPRLRVRFRRNHFELGLRLVRCFCGFLQITWIVPGTQVPHQNNAARQVLRLWRYLYPFDNSVGPTRF